MDAKIYQEYDALKKENIPETYIYKLSKNILLNKKLI